MTHPMTMERVTLVDDGVPTVVDATVGAGRLVLADGTARALLGRAGSADHLGDLPTDLEDVAAALGRPVAVDTAERAAYLGAGAEARGRALASLAAPDFTLPDLDGRPHRLSAYRGRKVLLIAYSSW